MPASKAIQDHVVLFADGLFPSLLFRSLVLVAFFSVVANAAFGQDQQEGRRKGSRIIDDTTKQVYGPKTSRYYYERDVFLNRLTYHAIDTAIHNFHRWTYVQRNDYRYQDLGNVGTSIRSIFYKVPDVIGASSGFQSYDLYWDSEQMKMYDTKSPYTNMYVMLGGKGRSVTRASFSRNINPRWNFGFDFRTLLIDKQIQRQSKGDRNVRSTYYDLYTSFQSKDSTYRVISSFRRNSLEADEYGGVRKNETFEYEDYFFNNAQANLLDASSKDLRMHFHLFHQYEVARALQIYHVFDRYRQGTRFTDRPSTAPKDPPFYDHTEMDNDTTEDRTKFKYVRNEVGIKGNLLKLFYNGYYAARYYSMAVPHADTARAQVSELESYIGGRISLRLDSLGEVTGWGELQQNGNYRLEGQIKSKWIEASLKQVQYSTPRLYQTYRGAHDVWSNDFSDINVTQLNGYLHYSSATLNVSPGLTFTRLGNYVFFKYDDYGQEQTVLPVQTSGEQVIFSPELKVSLTVLGHVNFNTQIVYTKMLKNTGDAFQIPELFVNAQLAYENVHFNDNLIMHAGIDLHYQSDYFALAYDVPIQQFYVQQDVKVLAFPMLDVFFSARIKKGKIFFKYNNIIQAFTKEGYLVTPDYPGQRNILDFGFDWSFYD
ncbi:MAG TPA: putative porin [Chryseolinea sp.]|nr:putative porin [Chryseolinea sp.]